MGMLTKFIGMLADAGKKKPKQFTGGITPHRENPVPGASDWEYSQSTLEGGIPGSSAQKSEGYFTGYQEPTFDYRFTGGEEEARRGLRNVGDVTRHYDQDAGFLSESVAPGSRNARPGFEVDFPPGQGYEKRIPEMLENNYVGLTTQLGPNGANRIVSQDIPEFATEGDSAALWDLISQPGALQAQQSQATSDIADLVDMFQNMGLDARPTASRTHVISKQDAGGYRRMEKPEIMRAESLPEALQRNYFERTGRRYPGPIQ